MKVGNLVIASFAKFFIGPEFKQILSKVEEIDMLDASGSLKRQAVLDALETMGLAITGWLLNLAVELAVAFIRSKA